MNQYDIFSGLLKVFPLPVEKQDTINFSFVFEHPKYETLKSNDAICQGGK